MAFILPLCSPWTVKPHVVEKSGSVDTGSGGAAAAGVIERTVAANPSTAVLKRRITNYLPDIRFRDPPRWPPNRVFRHCCSQDIDCQRPRAGAIGLGNAAGG